MTVPAGCFGTAGEFLCSAHAGYLTGQNVLLDGGAYPGTFRSFEPGTDVPTMRFDGDARLVGAG